MDWSRIDWERALDTGLWGLINLLIPLCIIPIAASCAWLRRENIQWLKILRDGQLCFYSICIMAASGYDVRENWEKPYVSAMLWAIILLGGCAILFFGLIFADGDGTLGHQRRFDDTRVVHLSSFIAFASACTAWVAHAVIEGAYK
jgi:hypothetical protein